MTDTKQMAEMPVAWRVTVRQGRTIHTALFDCHKAAQKFCPPEIGGDIEPIYRKAAAQEQRPELEHALEESVKLQSHYAEILNAYDNGERLTFPNAAAWMKRLKEMDQ